MSIRGYGWMIRRMVKESTSMPRELLTREAGLKTSSKATAKKSGQTAPSTQETTSEARSMAEVSFNGPMEPSTRETGKIIRCTAAESSSGLTAEYTRVNTTMIRNMGKEFIRGQIRGCIRADFLMASSMARVCIGRRMARRCMGYGRRVRRARYARITKNFKVYKTISDHDD
jgi:hypothetical protein